MGLGKIGDRWHTLYKHKPRGSKVDIDETIELENVKGKIEGSYQITEDILNDWGNRYSSGYTAPRTTGGTSR